MAAANLFGLGSGEGVLGCELIVSGSVVSTMCAHDGRVTQFPFWVENQRHWNS